MSISGSGIRPWNQPNKARKQKPKGRRDKAKLCPPEPLYTALADLDFTWYTDEVNHVIQWWSEGISLEEMSKILKRDQDEVSILLIDLARTNKIEQRKSGIYGNELAI